MLALIAAVPPAAGQPAPPTTHAKNDPRDFMGMGAPVACPPIAAPKGDPAKLAARGALAGLLVDLEGFLREDMGIEEAVALFGKPVMCDGRGDKFGYRDLQLLPVSPDAHAIRIETRDGAMIGIVMEYDPPVSVDMTSLTKRFGTPRMLPPPEDSFDPAGNTYEVTTPAFTAQLMFSHQTRDDTDKAWKVDQLILRRSAVANRLPEGFTSAADVDRLIKLTLRAHPPDTVVYFGTIGIVDKRTGDHISFRRGLAIRNVKSASMEKRTVGERDLVHAVTVTFTRPIEIGKAAEIAGVKRTLVKGKLTAITITRPEP